MPRDAAYELTDAEKRDLIKLINQGKPLPEKYRFILFADKREVELAGTAKAGSRSHQRLRGRSILRSHD